jgi:hypothetical protein
LVQPDVRQEDLDRDRVIFQRDIVLNPNKQEQFWIYFMAQPRGLPQNSAAELDKILAKLESLGYIPARL